MHSAPAVSVVIPCWRQAALLPRALASVLAQRPEPEIIVVDDGSDDDVAGTTAAHVPGATCIRQENLGLAAARNAGLAAARGRFVAFLDADDRLLEGALAAGLACHRRHPGAGFVFGGYTNVDEQGRTVRPPARPRPGPITFAMLLRRNVVGMHGTALYRREAIEALSGFDARLRSCEDYDLYLRMALRWPVFAHDVLTAEYRRREGTLSRQPLHMIESGLAVLRAHGANADTDELRRARRASVRFLIAKYGWHLARGAGLRILRGDVRGGFGDISEFARRMPQWLK